MTSRGLSAQTLDLPPGKALPNGHNKAQILPGADENASGYRAICLLFHFGTRGVHASKRDDPAGWFLKESPVSGDNANTIEPICRGQDVRPGGSAADGYDIAGEVGPIG